MSNPITLVYDALWEMIETNPSFIQSVKPGNRIKFNSSTSRDPLKEAVALSDLPEVMLIIEGGNANMYDTSSSSRLTRSFAWVVSTGDYRLTKYLTEIEWQIYCAMHAWPEKLAALQWKQSSFVKKATIVSITAGYSDAEKNRGVAGWSAVWRLDVDMVFKSSDLKAELTL